MDFVFCSENQVYCLKIAQLHVSVIFWSLDIAWVPPSMQMFVFSGHQSKIIVQMFREVKALFSKPDDLSTNSVG